MFGEVLNRVGLFTLGQRDDLAETFKITGGISILTRCPDHQVPLKVDGLLSGPLNLPRQVCHNGAGNSQPMTGFDGGTASTCGLVLN